jgi:hypothetical protein
LCIAKRATFHFNIAIAELAAVKSESASTGCNARPIEQRGLWLVAYRPEIFSLRDCPHTDCRDDATVVSHQRDGTVVWVRHRII